MDALTSQDDPDRTKGRLEIRVGAQGGAIVGRSIAVGAVDSGIELAGISFKSCSSMPRDLKNAIARYHDPWILLCADVPEDRARQLWHLAAAMRPAAHLIIQGPPDDLGRSERWVRRGCAVYLSMRIRRTALEEALRAAIRLNVRIIGNEFALPAPHRSAVTLSQREAEILQLVSEGLRNLEIAARVGLSENTIEFHVGRVLDKLGARNRVQAASDAIRSGVI